MWNLIKEQYFLGKRMSDTKNSVNSIIWTGKLEDAEAVLELQQSVIFEGEYLNTVKNSNNTVHYFH
jgi:hypothetical protein